jgi:Histone methylation protein DOT1
MTVWHKPRTKVLRDWMESVRRYGALHVAAYLFDVVRVHRAERAERFDARFGTDTAAVAYPWNLPSIGRERTPEIHPYEATPAWLIREILRSLPLQPDRFAFVDMGSGKGRALLVASEWPFAKIVGVELSKELDQIAEDNIKQYRPAALRGEAFSLMCMNAVDYTFGPEPLVLFLFNPFGEDSVSRILANLKSSLIAAPRQAFVVYINPRFETLARNAGFLRRVRKGGVWWRPWGRYVIYEASTDA